MQNEYEHIDDSKLKALKVEGGFTHPDNYFDEMQDLVLTQTTFPKTHSDFVPENYFEQSRLGILQKTIGSVGVSKLNVWYNKPIWKYTAVASLIFIASITFLLKRNTVSSFATASLNDDEIINYLEQTDLRDISIMEVSFASVEPNITDEESYIINQTDEQQLLEEL